MCIPKRIATKAISEQKYFLFLEKKGLHFVLKYGIIQKSVSDAGMMELADVLDSKSSGSDTVRVRPPLPAPEKKHASACFFQRNKSLAGFVKCPVGVNYACGV